MRFLTSLLLFSHHLRRRRRLSSNSLSTMSPTRKAIGVDSKSKVTVIGSGNWGSVAAKLVAANALNLPSFHDEVRMWVFEEDLPNGEKLTDAINKANENVKYLPGIKLGRNVVADPDLENAIKGANMLVFVTPHQFMDGICKQLKGKLSGKVEAISLVKGMEVKKEGPCIDMTMARQLEPELEPEIQVELNGAKEELLEHNQIVREESLQKLLECKTRRSKKAISTMLIEAHGNSSLVACPTSLVLIQAC